MNTDEIGKLHFTRSRLNHEGRFEEAIPYQLQILEIAKNSGRIEELSNAWNYLSVLYLEVGRYDDAEAAAQEALHNAQSKLKVNVKMTVKYFTITIVCLGLSGCGSDNQPTQTTIQPYVSTSKTVTLDQNDPIVKSDRDRLEGVWTIIRAEKNGVEIQPPAGFRYAFSGDKMVTSTDTFAIDLIYNIDPTVDPKCSLS